MIEDDLDLVMARPSLLDSYWRLLNEPIPSTYFRFAKSKVILYYNVEYGNNNMEFMHVQRTRLVK